MARDELVVPVDGGELVGWVDGDGPNVLALHGGPGLSYWYIDDMVAELATRYRVATYQQRGLAPSLLGGPFSVGQEVEDACVVLNTLGWESAYVVGHSWGGHLLLHLALEHPDRVTGGLAVDPLGGVGDGGAGAMSARFDAWLAARGEGEPVPRDGESPQVAALRQVWPAYFAAPDGAPPMPDIGLSPDSYTGVFASIAEEFSRLSAGLGAIEVPFGFVAGGASPLSPDQAAGPTCTAMPNAWLEVVEGAGHFVWVERPGRVVNALDRLVAG